MCNELGLALLHLFNLILESGNCTGVIDKLLLDGFISVSVDMMFFDMVPFRNATKCKLLCVVAIVISLNLGSALI